MDDEATIAAMAALAQGTRLAVFRLLVSHEPDGLASGEIARELRVPHNTMSTHLAVLSRACLVRAERQSRTITYRADLDRLREVTLYLVKDCCGARPALCEPLVADLRSCCRKEAPDVRPYR